MASGKNCYSQAPDVEDYERFFAEKLTEAQNVIHITMAKNAGQGYYNALEAAKSFENVTILDSGHLSGGMGLAVLYAASMAEKHISKAEIIHAVKKLRHYISSTSIIDSTHMMCQAGKIPKRVEILCDTLLLHPIIQLRQSKMIVSGLAIGNFTHIARHYVRKMLINAGNIDRRILFITYVGMDDEKLRYIQSLVNQYCPFERIYLQKASSAVACNCGPGSFGLLFMRKNESDIFLNESAIPEKHEKFSK